MISFDKTRHIGTFSTGMHLVDEGLAAASADSRAFGRLSKDAYVRITKSPLDSVQPRGTRKSPPDRLEYSQVDLYTISEKLSTAARGMNGDSPYMNRESRLP